LKQKNHVKEARGVLTLMLAPFVILFALFTLLPILSSFVLSFFSYDMVSTPVFAGLENYIRMIFFDEVFILSVKNTFIFALVTGPVSFFLAFILARG